MPALREESDSLGTVPLEEGVLWGAQTERARRAFQVTGIDITRMPTLIAALAMVKQAAARTNANLGYLSPEKAAAIDAACAELIGGRHISAFPLDVIQGGAGTSVNMNANEVIANLANEYLGARRGTYTFVHPNDDVNRAQSTNDVYPTAIRISLVLAASSLSSSMRYLASAFEKKSADFHNFVKVGRTQLQDAVPMTLGQEFSGFSASICDDLRRLDGAVSALRRINLGGTAVGTGINAPGEYTALVLKELRDIAGMDLVRAPNLFQASWDAGDFVLFSGVLKQIAVNLSKIANDLRLLSSGPRAGLGEIRLPDVQPGSSIMPGKVNPVIPEAVSQACFQVIGSDMAVAIAAEAGQLQLNAMEPLIAWNLHMSINLLTNVTQMFRVACVDGIEANPGRCRQLVEESTGVATALVPVLGYERSAFLAKQALISGRTVAEIAVDTGMISPEEAVFLLEPMAMAIPALARTPPDAA